MTHTVKEQIHRIKQLQNEAKEYANSAVVRMDRASKLADELEAKYGGRFVFDGVPYLVKSQGKFLIVNLSGNRNVLVVDESIRVIPD